MNANTTTTAFTSSGIVGGRKARGVLTTSSTDPRLWTEEESNNRNSNADLNAIKEVARAVREENKQLKDNHPRSGRDTERQRLRRRRRQTGRRFLRKSEQFNSPNKDSNRSRHSSSNQPQSGQTTGPEWVERTHMVSKMGCIFCFLPTSCASCFDHTIRMDTEEELGFSMVKNKIYRQSEVI